MSLHRCSVGFGSNIQGQSETCPWDSPALSWVFAPGYCHAQSWTSLRSGVLWICIYLYSSLPHPCPFRYICASSVTWAYSKIGLLGFSKRQTKDVGLISLQAQWFLHIYKFSFSFLRWSTESCSSGTAVETPPLVFYSSDLIQYQTVSGTASCLR